MKREKILLICMAVLLSVFTSCDNVNDEETALIYVRIGDAAHDGPSDLFYLLPPLVEEPTYSGVFDGSLSPTVSIPAAGIEFTSDVVPGSDYIKVDPDDEQYLVNWRTEVFDVKIPGVYRISFKVANTEIGFLEIEVFENPEDVVLTGDELKTNMNPGRTLPIKFRIERPPIN